MALQWVNMHIGDFGGDVNRVTIVGESAGSNSAMLHGLYLRNAGLFQRIISQSGFVSAPGEDYERNTLNDVKSVAINLGCLDEDISHMIDCLRGKSIEEHLKEVKRLGHSVQFGPVIDGVFIKVNPKNISRLSENKALNEIEFFFENWIFSVV